MQKKTFSRMLAALLTVLLLTQTLCITAFAENPVEVLIPQGSDTNAILTAALIPDATETQSWEYKCEGTSKIFTKNTAWGSVNGFESSTKKFGITTTYTHAALAANTDGQYQVRVAGTTKEYTIEKKAKLTSGIELKTGVSVALVYGEGGTLDAAATEDAIVRAVVKSVKPADAALTVEYYATATSGSLGSAGKNWMPIAGGKSGLLTYPAISAGEQKLRISWAGNDQYSGFEQEITVTMLERGSAPYERIDPANSVKLVYNDDLSVDYAQLKTDLFSAIIAQSDVLTAENVTMEYYAIATTGSLGDAGKDWAPLEGGKVGLLTYPAISEGEQQIRLTYAGDKNYAKTEIVVTVDVKGRDPLTFDLNEGPYEVPLVFAAAKGYDYDATAKSIYDTVVKGTSPIDVDFSEVTVEYDIGAKFYRPLNNSNALERKFGEGTWNIRFRWPGSREVAPGEVVVSVTMTDSRLASSAL